MKTTNVFLTTIFCLILSTSLSAQTEEDNKIYGIADESAKVVGGMPYFFKWIGANIEYPPEARKNRIYGKVFVTFVVEKDSSLSNFKIARGLGYGCDEEAIRMFSQVRFVPAKHKGKVVRQKMTFPITFADAYAAQRKADAKAKANAWLMGFAFDLGAAALGLNGNSSSSSSKTPTVERTKTDVCDGVVSNIYIPSYDEGEWGGGGNQERHSYIEFDDNISGTLYLEIAEGSHKDKYFIEDQLFNNYYYQSKIQALKALYIYKRCGKIIK